MQLFDVIHEMHVVGVPKNDHTFRGRYSVEDLVHAVEGKADVVVSHQNEGRHVAPPLERQLRRQNPGPRIRTSAWRERDNRPNVMQHVGRGERSPAAEAVAYDAYGRRFEPRFGQDIVEKNANVWNAARDDGFGSRGVLFRNLTFPRSIRNRVVPAR